MSIVKNPIKPGDGDPRHGTAGGYTNHGCRCEFCTEAWRVYHLRYMHENPEQMDKQALRTRLRLHATRRAS